MKRQAFLFAALVAATPALFAQDEKKQAGNGEKTPDPKRKEHDALKALAGNWDSVMKMEAVPGVAGMAKPSEWRGFERAELICNGLWLKSVVTGTHKRVPFQGVWIAGYDPFHKKHVSVSVSSDEQEGGARVMYGSYDEKTKTWTWSGTTPHGELRSTYAFKDADTTVETCYLKTPDGKETKYLEATRTRTSSPVAVGNWMSPVENLSPEQAVLKTGVGNWGATVKTTEASGQAPAEEQATERVFSFCHGRWIWSDLNGRFHGAPFEGHALYGYDPNEKKYVSFWIHSTSPILVTTSGNFDAAKKACTLSGTSVDQSGKQVAIKEEITWQDDNTRVLHREFKGSAETSSVEITYKRKLKK